MNGLNEAAEKSSVDQSAPLTDVVVRSVVPLTEKQKQMLEQNLWVAYGIHAKFNFILDQDLIGGMIIQAGDVLMDGSLKSKLTTMRNHLQSSL